MPNSEELVVLVDENDNILGTAPKATIHTDQTPLHRAFSCFIFNSEGELLLQQRALHKVTWPGVWANSCCGHPAPDESYEQAVKRRVKQELDLDIEPILMLPNYRYKAEFQGVVENEICPVFVAKTNKQPRPNPNEINALDWQDWQTLDASNLAIWTQQEVELLKQSSKMNAFLSSLQ